MGRGRVENLRTPSTEEARRIGRKGGKASAQAKQEAKTFKSMLAAILDLPMEELENVNPRLAIVKGMILKAAAGDKGAADWVRDTAGEKPVDKQEGNFTGKIVYGWDTDGDTED